MKLTDLLAAPSDYINAIANGTADSRQPDNESKFGDGAGMIDVPDDELLADAVKCLRAAGYAA